MCSLLSICCPSASHCSSGVNQKPAGWCTLLQLRVILVSTRIRQRSLQEAQWLPFSSQAYRTCQRIQIISCFTTTEWNTNARVDLLMVSIYKVWKTRGHLPFSFPCCFFAVCSRKTVQYILRYLSSPKCSIRSKLRSGMKIWQSKLWNYRLWSQTLRWRCTNCPWTWAAHHVGRSGSGEYFLVKLLGTRKILLSTKDKSLTYQAVHIKPKSRWKSMNEGMKMSHIMGSSSSARCSFLQQYSGDCHSSRFRITHWPVSKPA